MARADQSPDLEMRAEQSRRESSPFVLWEGGGAREDSSSAASSKPAPRFALAVEAEPLPLDFSGRPEAELALPARPTHLSPNTGLAKYVALALVTISCALFFLLGSLAEGAAIESYRSELTWEPHRVVAGETLRSILSERELPPMESGRLILWVEEMNDLENATIYAGQQLMVPSWAAVS